VGRGREGKGEAWSDSQIYKYIFQMKYAEAFLSNSPRKLLGLRFEISKMLIAV